MAPTTNKKPTVTFRGRSLSRRSRAAPMLRSGVSYRTRSGFYHTISRRNRSTIIVSRRPKQIRRKSRSVTKKSRSISREAVPSKRKTRAVTKNTAGLNKNKENRDGYLSEESRSTRVAVSSSRKAFLELMKPKRKKMPVSALRFLSQYHPSARKPRDGRSVKSRPARKTKKNRKRRAKEINPDKEMQNEYRNKDVYHDRAGRLRCMNTGRYVATEC